MTCDFLVGPYFFETQTPSSPKRCSVTGTSYGMIFREQLIPVLQERHCLEITIFMQDGASPHIAKSVKKLLHIFGADRVIRRGFENACPLSVHRTLILAIFLSMGTSERYGL
ncbi:uncharacterized protein TNCV_1082981 [Trichonephila clavipes]|nr:uncharacterized protein TNCV_1082981 [Trichonephila clavipes]